MERALPWMPHQTDPNSFSFPFLKLKVWKKSFCKRSPLTPLNNMAKGAPVGPWKRHCCQYGNCKLFITLWRPFLKQSSRLLTREEFNEEEWSWGPERSRLQKERRWKEEQWRMKWLEIRNHSGNLQKSQKKILWECLTFTALQIKI